MDKNHLGTEGYWTVGNRKFKNKFQALVFATETNQEVVYVYFDQIWNDFDRSVLGKVSLKELYRQRAQQIRDSYDYLILYFSGGADSYNVLRSFVDNNIKLDEVCVKWPMAAVKSQVYKANKLDTSARNTLSEWDYAIKPVLDWVSQYYPQIKINIVDWTECLSSEMYDEKIFHKVNNWNDIEIPFMTSYSTSEIKNLDKGKTVGSVYGIDKPLLGYKDDKWFMSFTDTGTGMGVPSDENPHGTEYFYWSPKFPILAMEQSYQLASYIDKHPNLKQHYYSDTTKDWSLDFKFLSIQIQNSIARQVLYDNWTNSFQADKPIIADREDKHFWIFEHAELTNIRDSFLDMNSLFLSQIDEQFISVAVNGQFKTNKPRGIYKHLFSKWYFVKKINV